MVAIAVIRIGRSRCRPPSTTASRTPMPCRPVLVDQVHQHDRVGHHDADQHQHADQRRHAERGAGRPAAGAIAPVAANGIEISRISGCSRLRNVATMMTKTIAIAASTARPRSRERVRLVGADAADLVRRAGRQRAARPAAWSAPWWSCRRLEPVAVPVTVALRLPSIRVTCSGPSTSCDLGDLRRAAPTPVGGGQRQRAQRVGVGRRRAERRSPRPGRRRRRVICPAGADAERRRPPTGRSPPR